MTDQSATLAIDVGNSRIKCGLFTSVAEGGLPQRLKSLASAVGNPMPWEQVVRWLEDVEVVRAIVAGSNPESISQISNSWPDNLPQATILNRPSDIPVAVSLDIPGRVGIDRLLTALAVNQLREAECPAIIIDSGTATTVDLVAADGSFQGGSILPGLSLSSRSLHEYTALLPELTREEMSRPVPSALGKNTIDALRAGIFLGHIGAIRHLVNHLRTEQCSTDPRLFLTGGAAPVLDDSLPEAKHEPFLALQGLVLTAIGRNP